MNVARAAIRTPDHRIRVFVSSTLRELEPERLAVRSAVERLRLAPVMFELGARPHAPSALYRSYLEQSDIFVGIYWQKYGWVAPGERISGLEDEYRLSSGLPTLIYVKHPAPDREPRLESLLDDIRADGRTSYKSFRTPGELADLVLSDLATLLAERFDAARAGTASAATVRHAPDIPVPYNELVGRDRERAEIGALLARPATRIVTLVGPGGVGKSRLAIEIARDAAAAGREVAFAALESVSSPDRVMTAIARALGVRDTGDAPLVGKVAAAVAERDVLLVVDNMEHLLAAADVLVTLIADAPHLQLLVTSRSPLRLRSERVFALEPLDLPDVDDSANAAAGASAVALFVARATAVNPSFRLTRDNADEIVGICRAVDGMPLAIELAAARMRILSPAQILERMDSALDLLVSAGRDLPERQRAQKRTIEWSVDLLDDESRRALSLLSVFRGAFAFGSAEEMLAAVGVEDPLGRLEALVDASLLSRTEQSGAETFRMLMLVRAYADEQLTPELRERATAAWIDLYSEHAQRAAIELRGPGQHGVLQSLEREVENVAGVARALIDRRELDAAADYAWALYLFLWVGGYLGIVREWMAELLELAVHENRGLSVRARAIALYYTSAIRFWQDPDYDPTVGMRESRELFAASGETFGAALAGVSIALGLLARSEDADAGAATEALRVSLDEFRSIDDAWGQAMALVMLGRVALVAGDETAAPARFEESLRLATAQGELLGIVIALNHRGWARFFAGDLDGARADFARSLEQSLSLRHDEGIAYGLEGFVGLAAAQGDARRAGLLLGAARALRTRKGILNPGAFEFHMIPLATLREHGAGAELDTAMAEGRGLSVAEAIEQVETQRAESGSVPRLATPSHRGP
ncbi:ATP-binding protein [Microbacterium ulmi]|uniref:DUF4062 domain-containing protein n=1 Tax=Microbacterium ulmi TaxID=179095 RepID=A0A7Y2LZW9_9MICO|nr:DUF4062 domain-containing protein [Microbacterium ulmi]NII68953.1 putative ATPase [Microbacterium ulmi]NNH03936.1 DUF4062 domain-containing protein [Microbacterium ulmi]